MIHINGKIYITLTRAEEQTQYAVAYLRKLANAGKIDGQLVGRSWVVTLESIKRYADAKPQRKPRRVPGRRK